MPDPHALAPHRLSRPADVGRGPSAASARSARAARHAVGLGLVLAGLLAGCATPEPSAPAARAEAPAPASSAAAAGTTAATPAAVAPVPYADLPSFDRQLAQALGKEAGTVTVTSEDRLLLKELPPRLNKWLSAVDRSGGRIEVLPSDPNAPQPRAIDLIFTLFGAIRQLADLVGERQYAEAKQYDALLFWHRDALGDRVLDRVEWVRRSPR